MDDIINVALGFDAGYAPHAAAVVAAVAHFTNAKLRFLLLQTDVNLKTRADFERLAPAAQFVWIDIGDEDLPLYTRRYLSRATLFRLGLEKLAPSNCERVLYLDSDLTVLRDVRELWQSDLGHCPVGAIVNSGVRDGVGPISFQAEGLYYLDPNEFAKRYLPFGQYSGYFNAGVLLIDLKQVRAEGLFSRAIDFVAKHGEELPFGDQDALNWVAWGRWKPLDLVWNVQTHLAFASQVPGIWEQHCARQASPAIVHFTGPDKPWKAGTYHPWHWLYWESLARTPFTKQVERAYGMTPLKRLKLRSRWMLRKPRASAKTGIILTLADAARNAVQRA